MENLKSAYPASEEDSSDTESDADVNESISSNGQEPINQSTKVSHVEALPDGMSFVYVFTLAC